MLVLVRYPGERIRINPGKPDEILIEILTIQPNGRVRVGLKAPETIVIHREEVIGTTPREGGRQS